MFKDFDFSILDNPEYKEDAVREDIVSPILKKLGYSPTGENKIIRSRNLTHPFVHIGTTERKINIIPDYLLQIQGQNAFILDAKSPKENILKGKNVEQAYSYAIHSEIRVPKYALCNGRELTIFEVMKYEPIDTIQIENLTENWQLLERHLSPISFTKPYIFDFKPDFGLSVIRLGLNPNMEFLFVGAWVNSIHRIEDELYSIVSAITFNDSVYAASFDFSKDQYLDFLSKVPSSKKIIIENSLKRAPYLIDLNYDSFEIVIHAKLSEKVEHNEDEDYLPLGIIGFDKIPE